MDVQTEETAEDKVKDIELIIEQDEDGQVMANVPVRWKLSESLIQRIASEAEKPYMLLAVSHGRNEMSRHLVSLKAGMTYLQMRRPGVNTIHATVVWKCEWITDSPKDLIMNTDDFGRYKMDVLQTGHPDESSLREQIYQARMQRYDIADADSDLEAMLEVERLENELDIVLTQDPVLVLRSSFDAVNSIRGTSATIDVDVPQEMFAPDPHKWVLWFTDLYPWLRKTRDQCDVRRRALVTAFTLPFVAAAFAVAWAAVRLFGLLAIAALLLAGKRNINYSFLYSWREFNPASIWADLKPSFFTKKKVEKEASWWESRAGEMVDSYEPRHPAFGALSPIVILFLALPQFVISGWSLRAFIMTAVAMAILAGLHTLVEIGSSRSQAKRDTARRKAEQATDENAAASSKLATELKTLTESGPAKLSAMPVGRRTVKLGYQATKAFVCKPLAK